MDSDAIHRTLKTSRATKNTFIGVFPANRLPRTIQTRPTVFIANLQEDFLPGNHWVTFFLPEFENGVEFFDSLGQAPTSSYFTRFIARHGGLIEHNSQPIQSSFSDVCGEFSCIYAFYRSAGYSLRNIVNMFGKNKTRNDVHVVQLFNNHFTCNEHFERPSLEAFHSQSCSPQCHIKKNACVAPRCLPGVRASSRHVRARPPLPRRARI